jgi:branched-chain amino acid transport system permease protein
MDLLLNAIAAGILIGGFYAAVSLGISMTFGLLDVPNISHPVFMVAGAYTAYAMNTAFALDPIVAGLLFTPLFYVLGVVVYRLYYVSFE